MAIVTVAVTGHVLAPDGSAPTSGRLVVKLSTPGSTLDGSESVRVATEVTEDLGTGGTVSFALCPNDAITPSGTYYLATFVAQLASGRRVQWAEKWQLTSADLTLDIGAVPRIDAVPGVALAPSLAVAQALVDSAAASEVAAGSSAREAAASALVANELPTLSIPKPTNGALASVTDLLTGAVMTATRTGIGGSIFHSGKIVQCAADTIRSGDFGFGIAPASTNLFAGSENIAQGEWTTTGAGTVTSDSVASPDLAVTADTFTGSGVSNSQGRQQSYTYTATAYSVSGFFKAGTHAYVALAFDNSTVAAKFDLTNGVVTYTGSGVTAIIARIGSGWYRCSATKTMGAGAGAPAFLLADSPGTGSTRTSSASGTVYVWGMQLEAQPYATDYIGPTGSTVNKLTNPETINNAAWGTTGAGTIGTDATTAPNGTTTAESFTGSGGANNQGRYQSFTYAAVQYTLSAYFKAGTHSNVMLSFDTSMGNGAKFDLAGGTVGNTGAGVTAAITSVGSGWYRCSITRTPSAGASFPSFLGVTNSGDATVTSNMSGTFYVWGIWLELGASPSTYVSPSASQTSTRAAETLTVANPISASDAFWSVTLRASMLPGVAWSGTSYHGLFALGDSFVANMAYAFVLDGAIFFYVMDSTNAAKSIRATTFLGTTEHEFTFENDAGTMSIKVDGVAPPQTVFSAAGTGIISTMPANLHPGTTTGSPLAGYIRSLRVEVGVVSVVSRAYDIACLGDSITAGTATTPWPAVLATSLGGSWTASNFGTSGDTTTLGLARWGGGIRAQRHGSLVVLLGINDIITTSMTAAEIWVNLEEILSQALADGRRVVPVTVMPYSALSAPKRTIRTDLNALIAAYATANSLTLVDAATDMDDGTGALKAIYDSGDHLHPNQTGYDRIAALVEAAFP